MCWRHTCREVAGNGYRSAWHSVSGAKDKLKERLNVPTDSGTPHNPDTRHSTPLVMTSSHTIEERNSPDDQIELGHGPKWCTCTDTFV